MEAILRGIFVTAIGLLYAASASAADPAIGCQSSKLKTAAKYGSCLLDTEAKGVKTQEVPDYSRCDSAFSSKWQGAEGKAGIGVCPTEGDETGVGTRITYHADAIATLLSGGVPVDPYSPGTGQTTTYGDGDDGDVQPGAALAYQDNGDGTITDLNTGLMWEKKIMIDDPQAFVDCRASETGSCANPHDADNYYDWSDGPCCSETDYDGGVVTVFLEQLNNRCNDDTTLSCTVDADCSVPGGPCGFAGHRDWRLPTVNELHGIVDHGRVDPSIDPAFDGASCGAGCTDVTDPTCSCTQLSFYWSSTTYQGNPSSAWDVFFTSGSTSLAGGKTGGGFVRAVRAGS